jgi:hypothetical protein
MRKSNYRGFDFVKWGVLVKARDKNRCRVCGEAPGGPKELHAHHILPWEEFPAFRDVLWNGVTVCKECHYAIHGDHVQVNIDPETKRLRITKPKYNFKNPEVCEGVRVMKKMRAYSDTLHRLAGAEHEI